MLTITQFMIAFQMIENSVQKLGHILQVDVFEV